MSVASRTGPHRLGKRQRDGPNSLQEKKEVLLSLLAQARTDIDTRNGRISPPPRMHNATIKDFFRVKPDEYFLLMFYEPVSYRLRRLVDLSDWGPELTPEVSVERLPA